MNNNSEAFIKIVKHPFKFRMFLLAKLPSAYFSGVRVKYIDNNKCEVTVPFKWFSQNPFKSIYFACLSMAAEMSTGALAMAHLHKRNPAVSMLVVKNESAYFKKAVNRTTFTCEDGALINQMIEDSIASGESRTVTATSIGKNEQGELVAEFKITWSFKTRTNK